MTTHRSGIIAIIMLTLSCSQFHITREINEGSTLSKLKNTGILLRLPHNSPITLKKISVGLSNWLESYKKINNLIIIPDTDKDLNRSKGEYDRFLQFSSNNDFQYYQARGIIQNYLNKNAEKIEKIKIDNKLDSLIIYEVDCFVSAELQVTNFSSMIAVVNATNQILYMDHQFDTYDVYEIDREVLQEHLIDRVSNRLLNFLMKYDYIKEK
jgi:hypothetical protein